MSNVHNVFFFRIFLKVYLSLVAAYCFNFQNVSFWFGKFNTFCLVRFFQALYTLEKMARNIFSDTNLSYGSWEAIQIGAHYHLHISHKSMWVWVRRSAALISQKIFWDKVLFQQNFFLTTHWSHKLRVVAEYFNCVFNMIFGTSILLK